MTIHAIYASESDDVVFEHIEDTHDNVERSGYVSPDKKIRSFIESGQLLQNYRASGDDYELQGEETELEPDSEEYRDELTKDAEKFDEDIMPQHLDKLSASEILDNADKEIKRASVKPKKQKETSDKILEALDKINSTLETSQVADSSESAT